ncbi:FluC/FEX family fluoride channel [Streptomyces sp. 4N509B]|uniref:FluC/FEX family fluoride channel n=1 Tax=Streptomyces sp. 4N509B TaxID=3457413 RepID=UPI003FD304FB
MDQPAPRPASPWRGQAPVLAVVAAGGGLGSAARYGAGRLWPTAEGGWPWATFGVNAAGCALIGVLMVLITEVWAAHRLVRPFLGTGVLGGFTTFSTYSQETHGLLVDGRTGVALAYLTATVAAALSAVWLAAAATRAVARRGRRHGGADNGRDGGDGGDGTDGGGRA